MNQELTIIEALIITNGGWRTEEERELFIQAQELLLKEKLRLHLENKKRLIEEKLETFNTKEK